MVLRKILLFLYANLIHPLLTNNNNIIIFKVPSNINLTLVQYCNLQVYTILNDTALDTYNNVVNTTANLDEYIHH